MNWEDYLIPLYLRICKEYRSILWTVCQRFTNGGCKGFTDEEAMLIYLFGVMRGFRDVKSIHRYTRDHLGSWFPSLPGYAGFVHRINRLHEAFQMLLCTLQADKVSDEDEEVYLIDSFPITLARNQHAYRAQVAPEVASISYHSTKKMYYYGVKAHLVARRRPGTLPELELLMIEEAARQDGPVFDYLRPMLHDNLVFADKAYNRPDALDIELSQNLKVITPITKARGQKKLQPEQRQFSKAVSRIRQPIEALFAWINRLTGIQNAGLVRSTAGLWTHLFGRFVAAMWFRTHPHLDF
jgi:Transposase DDE domain